MTFIFGLLFCWPMNGLSIYGSRGWGRCHSLNTLFYKKLYLEKLQTWHSLYWNEKYRILFTLCNCNYVGDCSVTHIFMHSVILGKQLAITFFWAWLDQSYVWHSFWHRRVQLGITSLHGVLYSQTELHHRDIFTGFTMIKIQQRSLKCATRPHRNVKLMFCARMVITEQLLWPGVDIYPWKTSKHILNNNVSVSSPCDINLAFAVFVLTLANLIKSNVITRMGKWVIMVQLLIHVSLQLWDKIRDIMFSFGYSQQHPLTCAKLLSCGGVDRTYMVNITSLKQN